jgi:hypothetical protein
MDLVRSSSRATPSFRAFRVPWPLVIAGFLGLLAYMTDRHGSSEPISTTPSSASQPDPDALSFDEPSVEPELDPGVPEGFRLRMPFPAGVVVLCAQGNGSAPGRTHSLPQNLHALDFSNRVLGVVPVVAAAAGTVVYVYRDAGDAPRAGGGYGNQVRVRHTETLFTEYAHLDQVEVKVGDEVTVGQRLGTMGRTGLAGDRHLHFSLHRGVYREEGLPPTVPIPELVTLDIARPGGFAPRPSWGLRCAREGQPWVASLYASENDGQVARDARRTRALTHELAEAGKALRRSLERRTQLWHFSTQVPRTTAAGARQFLAPILAEAEEDPIVQYGWAVEVEMPEGRWQAALQHLERARQLNIRPELFEPWIEAWVDNQEGAVALRRGQPELAREHFERARTLLRIPEVARFATIEWAHAQLR